MANWYSTRFLIKAALGTPASTTTEHAQYDAAIESVSRLTDDYVGFHFYPSIGSRYITARNADRLYLDAPLLAVDSIQTSSDGGTTYGSTMASDAYYLLPYNATEQSPKQPWWEIEIRPNTTASGAVFPTGLARGTRITGTWGYFNETKSTTAKPSTAIDTTATILKFTGATGIHAGMTLLSNSEQMFVVQGAASASAGVSASSITVERARNGTTAATHSSNSVFSIYTYPIVDQAVLFQAAQDYRSKDSPLGLAGVELLGGAAVKQSGQGGLHPFTRRMLESFRVPIAI